MSNALNIGNVTLPGDNYPALLGFSIPILDSLEGAFLLGDGIAQMTRNYAPSKADAKAVGTLRSGAGYAILDESGYLNTGIMETAEMTVIAVGRAPDGTISTNPAFVGNNLNTGTGGFGLFPNATGAQGTSIRGGALERIQVTSRYQDFTALSHRLKATTPNIVNNLSSGESKLGASSAARTLEKTNPILIGRLPSSAFKTTNEQIVVLIYSKALSDTELATVYAWVRSYAADKGFAV